MTSEDASESGPISFLWRCSVITAVVVLFIIGTLSFQYYSQTPQFHIEEIPKISISVDEHHMECLEPLLQNPELAIHNGYFFNETVKKYCKDIVE